MKPFYRKRSAVAHGGRAEVTVEDVQLVRSYLRAAILKMIDDSKLSLFKSIDEVTSLVQELKFGSKQS